MVQELRAARSAWLTWLDGISDEVFFRRRPHHGRDWSFPHSLRVVWEHDAEHAAQIEAWRRASGSGSGVGPKLVLLDALEGARR